MEIATEKLEIVQLVFLQVNKQIRDLLEFTISAQPSPTGINAVLNEP